MIRTTATAPLKLGYMGVFATSIDCIKLPATIPVGSSLSYSILDETCNPTLLNLVLQGSSGLPSFMSFNISTNILTVTPETADIDLYTLDASFSRITDGIDLSSTYNLKSHLITIYRLEIGSGTISN